MNRIDRIDEIHILAELDASFINDCFDRRNSKLAEVWIDNSLTSFREYLVKELNGHLIPNMDIEYRTYVIHLIKSINENYIDLAVPVILGLKRSY